MCARCLARDLEEESPAGPDRVPAAAAPEEAAGAEIFGKYLKVKKLGRGGMGEVWKAWDTALERWVALKFLKGDEGDVPRFVREARTAGALVHPNIAAVYEAGEIDGKHYIAMQFVEGPTLDDFPKRNRRLLVRLIRDAARALEYAHENGIVHRDLKPGNLMVSRKEGSEDKVQIYVTDFGLARRAEGGDTLSLSGTAMGTPAYMSPEQARGDASDARSDVYGLGATLYVLLTDRIPFEGKNVYEILEKVHRAEPASPRRVDRRVDRDLETVVLKCLEKDPARRYPTARALAEDLTRYLEGEALLARPASLAYRFRKRIARNPPLASSIAILLLILAGSATLLTRAALDRSREREREAASRRAALEAADLCRRALEDVREARALWRTKVSKREQWEALFVRALDQVNAALALDPDRAASHFALGEVRQAQGRWRQAIHAYDRALSVEPASPEGWFRRGVCYGELFGQSAVGQGLRYEERSPEIERLRREAEESFRRHQETRKSPTGTDPEDLYLQAVQALLDGTLAGAERLGQRILRTVATDERVWMVTARAQAMQAKWREATETLGTLIADVMPKFAPAHVLQGIARKEVGDVQGAMEDLAAALSIDPKNAWAHDERSKMNADVFHDWKAAIEDCSRAADLEPDAVWPYVRRATARLHVGDRAGALEDCDRALRLGREDPGVTAWAELVRGPCRLAEGDSRGAFACLPRAIDLDPNVRSGYPLSPRGRRFLREWQDVVYVCTTQIERNPADAALYLWRAAGRHALGDCSGAIEDATRALEHAAQDRAIRAWAHLLRGRSKSKDGDGAGAVEDLNRALDLDPRIEGGWILRAQAHAVALEDWTSAAEDCRRALELNPGDYRAALWLGRASKETGAAKLAVEQLTKAILLAPREPAGYIRRAEARAEAGDREAAVADARQALVLDPNHFWARETLGLTLAAQGDRAGAIEQYSKLIDQEPTNPRGYRRRGRMRREAGEPAAALADFTKALELDPDLKQEVLLEIQECREILLRSPIPTPPSVSAAEGLRPSFVNFNGCWEMTLGAVLILQDGQETRGAYTATSGIQCTLTGNVADRKLTFVTREAEDHGEGWFELAEDGNSFSGRWRSLDGPLGWSPITGKRIDSPPQKDPTSALCQALSHPRADLRANASSLLGYSYRGSQAELSTLIRQLRAGDKRVRSNAALNLAKRGTEAGHAVTALVHNLSDPEYECRISSAFALGAMAPLSVPALVQILRKEDPTLSSFATIALTQCGQRAVPYLIEALMDDLPSVRLQCIRALGFMGPAAAEAQPALAKALEDGDPRVRREAADALGSMGASAKDHVPPLVERLKDPDSDVRGRALWALGQIGPAARSAIPAIDRMLQDRTSNHRPAALSVLIRMGTTSMPHLLEALKHDDPELRAYAASALGRPGTDTWEAVTALIAALKDPQPKVRAQIADALGKSGADPREIVPPLISILGDPDPDVRLRVVKSLIAVGPRSGDTLVPLIEAMKDADSRVRLAAAASLGPFGRSAVAPLIDLFQKGGIEQRRYAAYALRSIGPDAREAAPVLSAALKDPMLHAIVRHTLNRISVSPDAGSPPDLARPLPGHWPQWRGPARDNVSTERDLLQEWPKEGPPLLWEVDGIGIGTGAVAITAGRVFIMGEMDALDRVTALEETTGKPLWTVSVTSSPSRPRQGRYPLSRTPIVEKDRLYAFENRGEIVCLNARTGSALWRKDTAKDFSAALRCCWGYTDHLLLDGDSLICTPGGMKTSMAALDKRTGKVIWSSLTSEPSEATHSAPILMETGGVRHYVAVFRKHVAGFRANDGKVLWTHRIQSANHETSTPIALGDSVSGVANGAAFLLELKSKEGNIIPVEKRGPRFRTLYGPDSNLLLDLHTYLVGSSHVLCLDPYSGTIQWQRSLTGSQSMTYADGFLYVLSAGGKLSLVEPIPLDFVEKCSTILPGFNENAIPANPVVAGRRLYIRDRSRLLCFDVSAGALRGERPLPVKHTIAASPPQEGTK